MNEKPRLQTVEELEMRQDDVLRQLDELNSQLERVLREVAPSSAGGSSTQPSV